VNFDVVVAGGSVAGLLCAREISSGGFSVLVIEEDYEIGTPEWFDEWWNGQEKVVLKVSGIKDLQEIKRHAIDLNLPWSEVTDAGHTQIAPGTTTCISIGPAPENLIDKITGDLKLL